MKKGAEREMTFQELDRTGYVEFGKGIVSGIFAAGAGIEALQLIIQGLENGNLGEAGAGVLVLSISAGLAKTSYNSLDNVRIIEEEIPKTFI